MPQPSSNCLSFRISLLLSLKTSEKLHLKEPKTTNQRQELHQCLCLDKGTSATVYHYGKMSG